ncbi:dol-P-Glc:Glc(2)Man(9)GlcNAc(2)-PP-Dol alpha-1 2-glucosyltransferase isoform X1 [Prunus yedoensis var. nudiflora]|uniref:Dol-P-Glc:Glc(2)Man(9)GlcNAc(2)-PP-Dol alpha-1,2-glucosyltransferase n=1 Tax=Prunus yedoensis var. nudiflora TaxID=2094558 RepID=A0A314YED3_PRUYE|nr:dol-P-Glc:Glc(2)Man(9)GlcNAc(2)-PP-Dol alpha-1 2-glucosyltransferase isoform X1 [Prunus yedoensis var. nudiflora]
MGRIAVAAIVSLWVVPISILVNQIVPEPYMDEIFHVPQAQQYCKGNFRSWDPMITTPPGLYYLSLAHVAYLFPGIVLVYEIITHLRPALDERKATFYAVVLACTLSIAWRLTVVIRQTNIVWMLFVCCCEVINITLGGQRDKIDVDDTDFSIRKNVELTPANSITLGSNLRKRKLRSSVDNGIHLMSTRSVSSEKLTSGFLDEIKAIFLRLWQMKLEALVSFSPFILVLAAFIAFVRWNGSVVLGAKEAHAVSPHFTQIMYFGLFSALMAPMHCSLSQAVDLFRSVWRNKFLTLFQLSLALGSGFISVHFFSIAHPYLLADNRHYPFYLWRKVIKAHWEVSEEDLGAGIFLGNYCSFGSSATNRVQILYHSLLFLDATFTYRRLSKFALHRISVYNHQRAHHDDVLVSSIPLVP